jgi:sulfur-carrier protein
VALIKLFGDLRPESGSSVLEFQGETVRALLEALIAAQPQLQTAIFAEDGLQPHVRIMVNGHAIELADGLETAVTPTDQIAIFPPIAGG